MSYEIRVKDVPSQPIVSIRARVPVLSLVAFFDDACQEMYAYLERMDVRPAGPPLSLWHSAPGDFPGESEIETCVPVEQPVPSSGRMTSANLPAGKLAYTIHEGPYDGMDAAFDAVWGWIQRNNREAAGPPRDVILVGPRDTGDPQEYRTEVAWPVR